MDSLETSQLKRILETRGLPTSGSRAALLARLEGKKAPEAKAAKAKPKATAKPSPPALAKQATKKQVEEISHVSAIIQQNTTIQQLLAILRDSNKPTRKWPLRWSLK